MIALDFRLEQGGFVLDVHEQLSARITALFGPSGAGKTTVLDAIAGLRTPKSGEISIGSRVLYSDVRRVNLPAHERHVGYVTQDVALFPHMNVRRNIEYGRRRERAGSPPRVFQRGGVQRAGSPPRVFQRGGVQQPGLEPVARMLEIQPLLERGVSMLSGGERQRVALARALMSSPELLLLDEPLAAVDFELRRRILPYLERVRDELSVPIIYVTHDRDELRHLAEHVIMLEQGRVLRSGEPARLL